MLAYAQDVGTELNEVYLQYSFISEVTVWEKVWFESHDLLTSVSPHCTLLIWCINCTLIIMYPVSDITIVCGVQLKFGC